MQQDEVKKSSVGQCQNLPKLIKNGQNCDVRRLMEVLVKYDRLVLCKNPRLQNMQQAGKKANKDKNVLLCQEKWSKWSNETLNVKF